MDIFTESGERSTLALDARKILNGNYELGRVLGKGGFGITYAALDQSLQMPVAIKEYLPTAVAGRGTDRATVQPHGGKDAEIFEKGLNAFLKEGQTLAKFNHPNIVRVLAFFRDNGTGYLVMPFLEGKTLAQHIRDAGGKLAPKEAARVILPVLDGLRSVHGAGFLHRDIKPQNIYLSDDGGVILIDFGAARIAFGLESQSLSTVLTPGYAPFEQYYRKGNQGPWTDVYAAAATFYRAITGLRPPESPERNETDELKPAHEIEPIISQALSEVLTRGLAPRPENRTQTVGAFYTELQTALGGEGDVETQLVETMPAETIPVTEAATPPPTPPSPTPVTPPPPMAETVLDESPPAVAPTPDGDSGPSSTAPTARLVLTARRPCQILIDGEEVARLSKGEARTFMLIPGAHQIAARGRGGVTRETTVELKAGEERRVTIRLDRASKRTPSGASVSSSKKGFPKGVWIGAGAVLLLVILAVAFWPRETTPISPDPEPQPAPPGPVEELVISVPYSGTGFLGPGDNTLQSGEYVDQYRFYGNVEQSVVAVLSSDDFDTYLIVVTPSGEEIQEDDYEGDTAVTVVGGELDEEGWYGLMVTSYAIGETGSYFLELSY